MPLSAKLLTRAARPGQLEPLRGLRAQGFAWEPCEGDGEDPCSSAAEGGHLQVLQWAHADGCPWNGRACANAAQGWAPGRASVGSCPGWCEWLPVELERGRQCSAPLPRIIKLGPRQRMPVRSAGVKEDGSGWGRPRQGFAPGSVGPGRATARDGTSLSPGRPGRAKGDWHRCR
jgi:hypothetical protein